MVEVIKNYRRVINAETEHILGDTIEKVAVMHERLGHVEEQLAVLPEMRLMITSISNAQTVMAQSAQSMADTFKRSEERQSDFEGKQESLLQRYAELVGVASGKDQIPLRSHFWSLAAALVPVLVIAAIAVLGVLYMTRYEIKATLDSIDIRQATETKKLTKEVESLADKVNP